MLRRAIQILFKSLSLVFCGDRRFISIGTKQSLLFRPVILKSSDPSKCRRDYSNETQRATEYDEAYYTGEYRGTETNKLCTRDGILILATPRWIGYKNCWSDAPMQQEGWVLPLPTYIIGAVHHEMGTRSSQLIVSRCRD